MTDRNINIDLINSSAEISAERIKQYDLKNRKKHQYFPTKVIDNFFEAPSLWRKLALNAECSQSTDGTWPGIRSTFLNDIDEEAFELLARSLLKYMPGYRGFTNLWTTFHFIDESYGKGWVHDDDPELTVSGLIYLNPTAPLGTGTTLYKDQYDHSADKYNKLFKQDVLFAEKEERKALEKYREDQRNCFTPSMTIENVYNRCIMFDPRVWHSPNNFFGTSKEDSRLTLVFFAKAG
jgi:hypothetical protein